MSQIIVDVPQDVAEKFSGKSKVSYGEMYESIVEEYEKGFEYERVNMKAGDFRDFLIKELSHD